MNLLRPRKVQQNGEDENEDHRMFFLSQSVSFIITYFYLFFPSRQTVFFVFHDYRGHVACSNLFFFFLPPVSIALVTCNLYSTGLCCWRASLLWECSKVFFPRSCSQLHCKVHSGTMTQNCQFYHLFLLLPVKLCDSLISTKSCLQHWHLLAPMQILLFFLWLDSPVHWPSFIHLFAGNQLDEKVDLSLSVNFITSGPTGGMST